MQKRQQKANGSLAAVSRRRKGGRKRDKNRQGEERSLFNSNLLKTRNILLAAELVQPVMICVTVGGATAGAVTFVDTAIKINSLADATWNGAIPGLGTYNEIYASYRIVGCHMSLECGSKHTANVNAAYLFTDSSSLITTSAGALAASTNQFGGLRLLSASTAGKPVAMMKKKVWFADVVGSDSVQTDDDYSAATNAVADPANLIYLHLMSATQTGNFAANGDVAFTLRVTLVVKFFNRVRVLL